MVLYLDTVINEDSSEYAPLLEAEFQRLTRLEAEAPDALSYEQDCLLWLLRIWDAYVENGLDEIIRTYGKDLELILGRIEDIGCHSMQPLIRAAMDLTDYDPNDCTDRYERAQMFSEVEQRLYNAVNQAIEDEFPAIEQELVHLIAAHTTPASSITAPPQSA